MPVDKSSDSNSLMIENLGRFIKYNKNLLHLDLSYTRLDEETLTKIGIFLRRAKSLLSIHLSGNLGVNQNLKFFLLKRLHGRDEQNSLENL